MNSDQVSIDEAWKFPRRVLPESHIYWTQYRFLPRRALYLRLSLRWLELAGWEAFDIQDGYSLDAPQAIPAGCQAGRHGFFGIANVDREWQAREQLNKEIEEIWKELHKAEKPLAHITYP